MNTDQILRFISLCLALAATETLHGILRNAVIAPRLGTRSALKLSIVTGSLPAFFICYLLVPGIGLTSLHEQILTGLFLALFMAAFDIVMGRWLLRRSWQRIFADFNPMTGNLLTAGLILLVFYPAIIGRLT